MNKNAFAKYALISTSYYGINAILYGYATVFLQSKGFSNTLIGTLFSCSAAFCVLFQLFSGALLDKYRKLSIRRILITLTVIISFLVFLLATATAIRYIFLCYVILISLLLVYVSILNAFGMEFVNSNPQFNFSLVG